MSDNGNPYRSGVFAAELQRVGARQIFTPPYTPRWNGKVERFFQTLKREWADAHTWPSSAHRTQALPSFIRYYNRPTPARLSGRPATHQPRSQPPWAGHLGRCAPAGLSVQFGLGASSSGTACDDKDGRPTVAQGKPVVRRGRKARDLHETARLPTSTDRVRSMPQLGVQRSLIGRTRERSSAAVLRRSRPTAPPAATEADESIPQPSVPAAAVPFIRRRPPQPSVRHLAPVAIATLLVAGCPIAGVWWLRESGSVSSPFVGVILGMVLSLGASLIGCKLWEKRPGL